MDLRDIARQLRSGSIDESDARRWADQLDADAGDYDDLCAVLDDIERFAMNSGTDPVDRIRQIVEAVRLHRPRDD